MLKETNYNYIVIYSIILYPAKISFRNEGKIRTSLAKGSKELSAPTPKKCLKRIFKTERHDKRRKLRIPGRKRTQQNE